ncbi:MAG: GGDEF domain-containing protein [Methylophilaceae bacterium]
MTQTKLPIEIARQTFMRLSKEKKPPTPDNYQSVYDEISCIKTYNKTSELGHAFQRVLQDGGKRHSKYIAVERKISELLEKKEIEKLEEQIQKLLPISKTSSEINWSVLIRNLLRQLDTNHKGVTLTRKKDGLSKVLNNFADDANTMGDKIQALVKSWSEDAIAIEIIEPSENTIKEQTSALSVDVTEAEDNINNTNLAEKWRNMMLETLKLELIPNLKALPDAHSKAKKLLIAIKETQDEQAAAKQVEEIKNILQTLEIQRDYNDSINEGLLALLRLMTRSMDELVIEDEWLHSQITIINDIVNKPIDINTLFDAESSLKDLIQKQVDLKPVLHNAKDTLKNMVSTFVNGLAGMTESTSEYHAKIESYQQKLSITEDMVELSSVIETILEDTRAVGLDVQRSRTEFEESQKKAVAAEQKIKQLTAELDHISEVAHEDFLTGTLNRRGMDDALVREFSRADRYDTTLSIAMMDIDHFKKLNDKFGHSKGDEALTHFAKVIKDVKRSTDVLARYGGEEFIIILPGTKQEEAINVITRVQRELTKNLFMSNDERVLITFSAGVAERAPGEKAESIVPRADAALYQAKQSGRNRVVGATSTSTSNIAQVA